MLNLKKRLVYLEVGDILVSVFEQRFMETRKRNFEIGHVVSSKRASFKLHAYFKKVCISHWYAI